ncbi:MAG: iron ABC transporter permease [Planctomycetaceae bacterium]|nr:iron ABC transporter permease [Planctomycetaceae bacterium]
MRPSSQRLWLITLLLVVGVPLVYPIWLGVASAFVTDDGEFTLFHVLNVFSDPVLREGLRNAFLIACCTTVVAVLIALPLAMLSARTQFAGKPFLTTIILAPLVLPPFVGAIGMRQLLGHEGAVNSLLRDIGLIADPIDFLGKGGFLLIVLLEAVALYPILYLNLVAAIANLDPSMEEAATNLGAGRWKRFFRVTLPLIRPGLFAGGTIVFVWSFTELGTPLMLEFSKTTPVQIFNGIKEMEASRQPYALTAVMLGATILSYTVGRLILGGKGHAMLAKASAGAGLKKLEGTAGMLAGLPFLLVGALAVLPHIGVIGTALSANGQWYGTVLPESLTGDHFVQAITHPLAAGAVRNSIIFAGVATILDVVVGLFVARLLVRGTIRGRALLDAIVMLPLAVPGLVFAFGLVAASLRWPFNGTAPEFITAVTDFLPVGIATWINEAPLKFVGDILGPMPNPIPFLILAYAVRRLPYVVRSAAAGLEQTSVALEEAGYNLGASRWRVTRKIVLPLLAANLAAGAILAFCFAMLEVSDSLILAQREGDYPITKAIFTLAERLGDGPGVASALGVWAMAFLGVALATAAALVGKKAGAIFRG